MSLLLTLGLALVTACSGLLGGTAAPVILARSTQSASGTQLDGSTVAGTITVYVDAKSSYRAADFYLDDPSMQGAPLLHDDAAPFELELDTTALSDGPHDLDVLVTIGNGGRNTKVAAQAAFTVDNSSPGGSTGGTTTAVQVFYYPWYGNPDADLGAPGTNADGWRHWQQNGHTPPDDLGASFYPQLGPYSSSSPSTLDQHMQWIADAGIGVAIVSWWGQGSWEDEHLPAVLDAAEAHGVKVAFHIEPYAGRTPASVEADVAYLYAHYGSHPAFFRVSLPTAYGPSTAPRAVVYVFDVLASGTLGQWRSAMDDLHGGPDDAFVLGQRVSSNPIDDAHFDGVYTYDVYAVDPSSFLSYAPVIQGSGGVFAPSVGPGYDERRAIAGSSRHVSRSSGQRYDAFWQDAIQSGAPWVTITSFNEWHEGTQIEPAVAKAIAGYTYTDYVGDYGAGAADAPMAYLQRTRHWVDAFLGQTPPPPPPPPAGVPRPDHVVIVIEENHAYSAIEGSSSAPHLNALAAGGALFTQSFAIEHPSEPNYLDLFSGSNQGVTDDSCPHTFTSPNLGDALIAAGFTFAAYSEDLPSAGSTVCTYQKYARKHAPWVNWPSLPGSTHQPFSSFPTDYAALPDVAFVIPNLDNDMHDGSVSQGDTWFQDNLGGYAQWALTHNSLLIVTFDEGSGSNQIFTVFYGQAVKPGSYAERIDHFDVLRTLEDMYGLGHAGASSSATPITDVWAP